jgi:hypothetical protein
LGSVWFYLNCANGGSASGAWWTVGSVMFREVCVVNLLL